MKLIYDTKWSPVVMLSFFPRGITVECIPGTREGCLQRSDGSFLCCCPCAFTVIFRVCFLAGMETLVKENGEFQRWGFFKLASPIIPLGKIFFMFIAHLHSICNSVVHIDFQFPFVDITFYYYLLKSFVIY